MAKLGPTKFGSKKTTYLVDGSNLNVRAATTPLTDITAVAFNASLRFMTGIICPSVLCCKQGTEDNHSTPAKGAHTVIRRIVSGIAFALLSLAVSAVAQTAQYTWTGSTDSSQGVGLASIDGIPANEATGWGGSLQIVNGGFLWLLDLPYCQYGTACVPMGFPNNGFLDCETAISWGAKQWGIRPDGTQMDGTKAGDSYTLSGSTVCPLWNGTTDISVTEFRMMVQHRSCGHGHCINYLVDTMESGNGTATVE